MLVAGAAWPNVLEPNKPVLGLVVVVDAPKMLVGCCAAGVPNVFENPQINRKLSTLSKNNHLTFVLPNNPVLVVVVV